jgi:phage/plasmid-like protein (TIGR03299 family)
MSANLAIKNGKHSFYSLRENAWHGLGQVVEVPVNDLEAQRLAGLDWEVELVPLCRNDMVPVDTHLAATRSDTKATLGIVGAGYTPVQNAELFEWLRGLEAIGKVTIETAGALGAGEIVWALARCDDLKYDINGDIHHSYMSLTNGHSGNHKLLLTPTDTRQCCANTTAMIVSQDRNGTVASGWELLHRRGIHRNLEIIQNLYAETAKAHKITKEVMELLASKPITDAMVKRMFLEPFIPKALIVPEGQEAPAEANDETVRAALIRQEREERLNEILASATCNTANAGSIYSIYQAVTEFAEHDLLVRPKIATDRGIMEARFKSANIDGRGVEIKRSAVKLALELAKA